MEDLFFVVLTALSISSLSIAIAHEATPMLHRYILAAFGLIAQCYIQWWEISKYRKEVPKDERSVMGHLAWRIASMGTGTIVLAFCLRVLQKTRY